MLLLLTVFLWISPLSESATAYSVGIGIADVTGPAAEINMMGYAHPQQRTSGIHTRLYSRTFIIDDGTNRIVFVNVDFGMSDQAIKTEVVKRLTAKYGSIYSYKNVAISGSHTHSGPAGYLQYVTFSVTSLGWVQQSFEALVDGIVLSVERAHENMKDAYIYYSSDVLLDANINRSPAGYLNNPEEERARYQWDTDKEMAQLKFVSLDGDPIGIINWFAVHLTSMNNSNSYISSDNKGYAALVFEAEINGPAALPGKGPFVASFAQSNLGDVSPNILGPRCIDTGLECDFVSSSCNNRTQLCIAFGPGKDMVESTKIIGERQYLKAKEMFDRDVSQLEAIDGPIQFVHQFVDMPNYSVLVETTKGTQLVKLCKAALGYSFAAGCIDGAGAFDFTQGATSENPFWNMVVSAIKPPSEEQKACHAPKPILLDTGETNLPYAWHPDIVETQAFRIGQFFIASVPGEFTTMAGRRLREKLVAEATAFGPTLSPKVVIAGLSNVYSHYITTFEEYQVQRYEAASVIYGPHTLSAYIDQYSKLIRSIMLEQPIPDGPTPPNLIDEQISLVPGVVFDRPPYGKNFGDCTVQPYPLVYQSEEVYATFVAGHPRNHLMLEDTFLAIEKEESGSWTLFRTDAHFDTFFSWRRTLSSQSEAKIIWDVPTDAPEGTYRIKHFGYYKSINGSIFPYEGTSRSFQVKARERK